MKRNVVLFALFLGMAFSLAAAEASTNVVRQVASPAARTQCEALTKSGTRCKRTALPGEKFCRQHKKIKAMCYNIRHP